MLMASKTYSAREMTEFARCTLGQLSYYREIRLLSPRRDAPDGTSKYDDVNLLRLQQIRMGRAAGLALEEIRRLLDDPPCKLPPTFLRAPAPTPRHHPTRAGAVYVETTAKVETEADRLAFEEEAHALYNALSIRWRSGAGPTDERLAHWVERHRCHLERWFCPCDASQHLAFARAVAQNPFLTASVERHGRNLTSFMISVIEAHTP